MAAAHMTTSPMTGMSNNSKDDAGRWASFCQKPAMNPKNATPPLPMTRVRRMSYLKLPLMSVQNPLTDPISHDGRRPPLYSQKFPACGGCHLVRDGLHSNLLSQVCLYPRQRLVPTQRRFSDTHPRVLFRRFGLPKSSPLSSKKSEYQSHVELCYLQRAPTFVQATAPHKTELSRRLHSLLESSLSRRSQRVP